VVDLFEIAGLQKPDLSILSDEFLEEVRRLPKTNLALEVLRKLLNDEIQASAKHDLTQSKKFSEMLQQAIQRYQNRAITSVDVITELIEIAKQLRAERERGAQLGLTADEVAFNDALGTNDSAVQVLGDKLLKTIAQELTRRVRSSVSIDWAVREDVRAKLRFMVKTLLAKYGYAPDKLPGAVEMVLQQTELLCDEWVVA
jgi:type I restriction enzyme R subunit